MSTIATELDQPPVWIPREAHTLDGFRRWATSDEFPERVRIAYIRGELFIDMSPERIESHIKVKQQITHDLLTLTIALNIGTVYSDGTLLTNEAADLSTEPDAMFATWETLRSGRLKLTIGPHDTCDGMEMDGTPDMVLEVVSCYSIRKDTGDLREAYYQAGIPEYWLANALGEEIEFQILVRGEQGYESAPPRDGWVHSPVFGHDFRLIRRRDPVGYWAYKLDARR